MVAMFIPETPAYAVNQSTGGTAGDCQTPVPGVVMFHIIPTLGKLRQEDAVFNMSLGYIVRVSQNTKHRRDHIQNTYYTLYTHHVHRPHT